MSKRESLSAKTRANWLIDAIVFSSAIIAGLSGIYFLYFPAGYQGGRNPWYGVTILFSRETWSDLHTWGSIAMIIAIIVHFAIHWGWVMAMVKRAKNILQGKAGHMSSGAKVNITVDAVIALGFLLTALSGLYFLFTPGNRNSAADFIFNWTTWDLIHTWAGTLMIIAAIVHFVIHWGWVTRVTGKFFRTLLPRRQSAAPGSISSTKKPA